MATLVLTLTLVGLLRMAHISLPSWHLAFALALLVAVALTSSIGWRQALLNGVGSFFAGWAYFEALQRTDTVTGRGLHYLILLAGMAALVASRLWIDIRIYGVGL